MQYTVFIEIIIKNSENIECWGLFPYRYMNIYLV